MTFPKLSSGRAAAAVAAAPLGAAVALAALGSVGPLPALALLGLALAAALALDDPDWALAGLCAAIYMNLSEIAAARLGAPSPAALLLAAGLGLAFLRFALLGRRPGWSGPAAAVLVAFGAAKLLSAAVAARPDVAAAAVADYARDVAFAFVIVLLLTSARGLTLVAWSVVGAAGLLASITVAQMVGDLRHLEFFGLGGGAQAHIAGEYDSWRPHGPLDDPNFYAQLLLLALPLAVDRALGASGGPARALAALVAVLIAAAVVATGSRGGLIAMIALLGATVLLRRAVAPALLLAVAAAATLPMLPAAYLDRLQAGMAAVGTLASGATDEAVEGRLDENRVAIEMFSDAPLLGVGAGNYPHLFQSYVAQHNLTERFEPREAHNLLLEIAAETGLLGLAAFGAVLLAALRAYFSARRLFLRAGRPDLSALAQAFLLVLLAHQLTSVFLHGAWARPWWMMVGVVFALPNVARACASRYCPEASVSES